MIPQELDLCVTDACNMKCRYCYAAGKNAGKKALTFGEMKKAVVIYLKRTLTDGQAVDKISISGGEPLTHWEEVSKFVKWLGKNLPGQIKAEIFTNGTLLCLKKAQLIVKNGLKLRLSIDGEKESHDGARIPFGGESSFDIVMKNLKSMPAPLRKELEAVPLISAENVHLAFKNMKFLLDMGFKMIRPSFVLNEVWPKTKFAVLKRELEKVSFLLRKDEKARKRLMKISLKNLSKGLEEFARSNEISIATDGYFYPSSLISASVAAMGNSFRRKYRIGSLERGIETGKLFFLRKEAWREIKKCGADLYLGCLLCMYYSVQVAGGDLKSLLLSAEKIAEITEKAGLGEIGP